MLLSFILLQFLILVKSDIVVPIKYFGGVRYDITLQYMKIAKLDSVYCISDFVYRGYHLETSLVIQMGNYRINGRLDSPSFVVLSENSKNDMILYDNELSDHWNEHFQSFSHLFNTTYVPKLLTLKLNVNNTLENAYKNIMEFCNTEIPNELINEKYIQMINDIYYCSNLKYQHNLCQKILFMADNCRSVIGYCI